MPRKDKSDAQSAVSAFPTVGGEGTVSGAQHRSEPAPAVPLEKPPDDSATKAVVEIRHVSEKIVRVELQVPNAAPEAAAAGAPARQPEESGVIRAAREEATVLQDDRAQKEARWKSLESLQPAVPGYVMLKKLGQGTYGVVWHAREESTGIEVAIKFFAHGTGDQWQTLQAEVKQLAMLHADPGIVQLIDVEPDAVPPYFVMDYAEQGSLAKRLESGPMPLGESVKIFHRVAEALAYVHAKGVRHCDLKPGNILLDARGRPKVADFGQAHLSSDASPALGTFFYMAPEQADLNKQIPDTRWDVYGMGALLYAMVTGAPPREDSTVRTQLAATEQLAHRLANYRAAVVNAPPVTKHRQVPGMDRALADIISRCLEVNPDERFHDANAILEALHRREWNRRQRPLLLFGLLAPLLILLMLGLIGWSQARTSAADFRASQERQVREDCKTAARLIQSVIKNKFLEQAERVKRLTENKKVREALGVNQQVLREEARLLRENTLRDESQYAPTLTQLRTDLEYLARNGFESWSLLDREGSILVGDVFGDAFMARDTEGGETMDSYLRRRKEVRQAQEANFGEDFSWRKYFNGQRDFYDRKPVNGALQRTPCGWPERPSPEARRVVVTDPYLNVRKQAGLSIGVAAPVYVEKEPGVKTLAGVLLGNVSVRAMHTWLAEAEIRGGHAVVLDSHNHCLFHTEEIDDKGGPVAKVIEAIRPSGVRDLPQFVFAAAEGDPGVTDPIMLKVTGEQRFFLAESVPIVGTRDGTPHGEELFRWTALVEQDRDLIMEPVQKIITQMYVWGLIKLAAAGFLLLGMWAWLLKKLTHEEKGAHA